MARPELECCALAGKAGGLRTAATVIRGVEERGMNVSLSWVAEQLEKKADEIDAQALALMPVDGMPSQ